MEDAPGHLERPPGEALTTEPLGDVATRAMTA
jgi:hypothetical protein